MGNIASSYPSLQPATPSPRASLPGLGKWDGRYLRVFLVASLSLCCGGRGGGRKPALTKYSVLDSLPCALNTQLSSQPLRSWGLLSPFHRRGRIREVK